MAKNLFEVVQALFLPCVLLAAAGAVVRRGGSARALRLFWRAFLAVCALVLAVSFLREARLIKYNQINNIYLLCASIVAGAAFSACAWIGAVRSARGGSAESPRADSDFRADSCGKGAVAFPCVAAALGILYAACLFLYAVPVVIVLPLHFVGMDDTYFSTQFLAKCTGFALGWLTCALAALGTYRVLSRCGARAGALCVTALYVVEGFISFVGIVGIINSYYRRKIKIPAGLRRALPRLITAENAVFFVALAVLIVLAASFFFYYIRIHGEYRNPAEHRTLRARARNNRRWAAFVLALAVSAWADMTAVKRIANRIVELSPSEEFQLDGGEIFIPLEQVADGHLHRFTWENGKGKAVRFIIVQKQGTSFGVGFDACEVCGNVGYYERKSEVICNRCDVVMNKSTIGLKGGCNPIPLASRIQDGGIVILTADLDAEAGRF